MASPLLLGTSFTSSPSGTVVTFTFDQPVTLSYYYNSFVYNSIGMALMPAEDVVTPTPLSTTLTLSFTDAIDPTDFLQMDMYGSIQNSMGEGFNGFVTIGGSSYSDINFSTDSDDVFHMGYGNMTIFGNDGNDILGGSYGDDIIHAGEGSDIVNESENDEIDIVNFNETTKAVDTFVSAHWMDGSGITYIKGFDTTNAATNDKLNLGSNDIAANATNVNGTDAGIIASHSIANGIATFKNSKGATILIDESNKDSAVAYATLNLATGKVAGVRMDMNGDGTVDSLAIIRRGILDENELIILDGNTGARLGKTAGNGVVQITDTITPCINYVETTANGLKLYFTENLRSVNTDGWTFLKNGTQNMGAITHTISQNTVSMSTGTSITSTDYILARPTSLSQNTATDMNGNSGLWLDDFDVYAMAFGGSGNNTIDLSTQFATPEGFYVDGFDGDDTITGSKYEDDISGDKGNDTIFGGGGSDDLDGGAGNDYLNGGKGMDYMRGGEGNDTYVVDGLYHGDQVEEYENEGTDTVLSYAGNVYLNSNVENLKIMTTLAANGGGNELNNNIWAGAGNNYMTGGDGNDTLSYATATAAVTVNLGITTAQATGGSGTDTISQFENLTGSTYHDTLTGNNVANTINGGTGNDWMNGGAGNDILTGLAGNDTLIGGVGNDKLSGGTGGDHFIFNAALNATTNKDTITDFVAADDTIKLENAIFTKLTTAGNLNAANFVASATGHAVDANDYVLYNTTSGVLSYDADGSGAGAAIAFALLGTTSHPAITAADFVVI